MLKEQSKIAKEKLSEQAYDLYEKLADSIEFDSGEMYFSGMQYCAENKLTWHELFVLIDELADAGYAIREGSNLIFDIEPSFKEK